jgi:hypothetical protein
MRSSKSRSRSKANRPRSMGNIINRVFDSSGPEGKVRGTPQQIIEKYQLLARDAQLSNDRVAAENFQQHAEHYTRLLSEAQREMAAEQEARQAYQQQNGNRQNGGGFDRRDDRGEFRGGEDRGQAEYRPYGQPVLDEFDEQPPMAAFEGNALTGGPARFEQDAGLVETPEARQERFDRAERGPQNQQRREQRDRRGRDQERDAARTVEAPAAEVAAPVEKTVPPAVSDEAVAPREQRRPPRGPRRPRNTEAAEAGADSPKGGDSREAAE